jgi:hypothetical protein
MKVRNAPGIAILTQPPGRAFELRWGKVRGATATFSGIDGQVRNTQCDDWMINVGSWTGLSIAGHVLKGG